MRPNRKNQGDTGRSRICIGRSRGDNESSGIGDTQRNSWKIQGGTKEILGD
jgi:hypothetical protein